jgi:uncharacterized membrane protein (UPF0127 family)
MTFGLPSTIIRLILSVYMEEIPGKNLERHRPARPYNRTRYLLLALVAGLLALTAACSSAATTAPTAVQTVAPTEIPATIPAGSTTTVSGPTMIPMEPVSTGPFARVGDLIFPVEVAAESEKRIKGLSGRASLESGTGMLFIFEKSDRFRFWMREMEFSLDIVWISSGCKVVDISVDVPFPDPDTALNDLPRYSPEALARYVLEINSGEALALGVGVGDPVEFTGGLEGKYGC